MLGLPQTHHFPEGKVGFFAYVCVEMAHSKQNKTRPVGPWPQVSQGDLLWGSARSGEPPWAHPPPLSLGEPRPACLPRRGPRTPSRGSAATSCWPSVPTYYALMKRRFS